MHATPVDNMRICFERFVRGQSLAASGELVILDLGGAEVNGNYADVFREVPNRYLIADIAEADNVTIVLEYPYRVPLDDASIDIVVSGQMLEHCEFFWLSFAEMVRVLKPGGVLFLIAPSAGPIHRYPVDCYRFHPDAYRALAKYANCELIDVWLDERGPWHDLVGVFARHSTSAVQTTAPPERAEAFDPIRSAPRQPRGGAHSR